MYLNMLNIYYQPKNCSRNFKIIKTSIPQLAMQYKFLTYTTIILGLGLIISTLSVFNLKVEEKNFISRITELENKVKTESDKIAKSRENAMRTILERKETQAVKENEVLSKEIKELNLALKEKDKTVEGLKKQLEVLQIKAAEKKDEADKNLSLLERLKKNDPEGYRQLRQRMDERSQRMEDSIFSQQDFIAGLDTSGMNKNQFENHEKLQETLKSINEKISEINQNPDSPEADDLRRDVFSSIRDTREMLATERNAALNWLARSLGYENEEDVSTFSNYVNYIYNMTSLRPFHLDNQNRDSQNRNQEDQNR